MNVSVYAYFSVSVWIALYSRPFPTSSIYSVFVMSRHLFILSSGLQRSHLLFLIHLFYFLEMASSFIPSFQLVPSQNLFFMIFFM